MCTGIAQARNMSIGEHRHCCVTLISKYKDLYGKKTYRFLNLRKWKDFNKKQLTLHTMCVTSLLCGPWADLWPFNGLYCKRFSLYITGERKLFTVQPIKRRWSPMLIFRAWANCWCALCVCKSLCKLTRGSKSLPKRKTIIDNIKQDFKTVRLGL